MYSADIALSSTSGNSDNKSLRDCAVKLGGNNPARTNHMYWTLEPMRSPLSNAAKRSACCLLPLSY
eukprot:1671608-Pyramimonas_sp.AAC.1